MFYCNTLVRNNANNFNNGGNTTIINQGTPYGIPYIESSEEFISGTETVPTVNEGQIIFIDENEKTHLITREEKDKEEYSYINIPIEGGYFLNKTVGFEYGKKEELYLKYLSQQRIRWKKMKFESKEVNSTSQEQ